MKILAAVAAGALAAGTANALPPPDHIYEFDGTMTDSRGGPAATNNGASYAPAGLAFGSNQGPTISGAFANPAGYSIEMFFELDHVSGYRKLIDFKNRTVHDGLYVNSGLLTMYGAGKYGTVPLSPNSNVHLVVTRDPVTELMVAYLNGAEAFTFQDLGDLGVFSATGGIAHFLRDDGRGGGGEATPGTLDFIRLYDRVLGGSDVATLYNGGIPTRVFDAPVNAVPEPATWAMLIAGFGMVGGAVRRRARPLPARVIA